MTVAGRAPSRTHSKAEALLESASELVPFLRAQAPETEKARWIGAEISQRLIDGGFYELSAPRRYGGSELSLQDQVTILAKIGEGCVSSGWVAGVHNASGWLLGTGPKALQEEVFNTFERTTFSGIIAPSGALKPVDGGYVLNGQWPFASGCLDATWALLTTMRVDANGVPRGRLAAIVPISELVVHNDWDTMALSGTGSNIVSAKDVFVPESRMLNAELAMMGIVTSEYAAQEVLYRSAPILAMGVPLVAPVLGGARAMLEIFLAQAKKRSLPYTSLKTLGEWSHVQSQVGKAQCLIDDAEFNLMECSVEVDRWAEKGVVMDVPSRVRGKAQMGRCLDLCRDAANIIMGVAGGSGIANANPIQRLFRDIHGANGHALLNPAVQYEVLGEALLGQPFLSFAI